MHMSPSRISVIPTWSVFLVWIASLGAMLAFQSFMGPGGGDWPLWVGLGAFFIIWNAMFVIWARPRQRVKKVDGRICFRCGYSTEGLPDEGKCPECGSQYSREANLKRIRKHFF